MKLSQLSISVLLLVCIVVSSCTQRRYGHLTIRVGSKKHQNVKVNSIRPFHGRLPNNIVSTWKGKDSAYGLSELTSIQQSLKNTYQPVLQVNKHLEPISAEHPIKRIRTSDTKAKFDEIDVLHPPRAKTKETTVTNYGSKNKNSLILAGTAAITSYISLFMLLGRGKLRKHVEWAKKNKKLARGMLIASRVFLGLIGISNGFANVLGSSTWAEIYGVRYIGSIKALTTAFMVFSTAFGTALFGILIDNSFSIEQIALVSGSYVLIAISLLFIIKNKLNPQYL